jgi:thymidylate synthase (FAD)
MRIVSPLVKIESDLGPAMLYDIERYGRTCYKSEKSITAKSGEEFVAMLIRRGHHSVLEHSMITVRFIVDRGVSHEIVRHRLAAYSQESTRYCNYTDDKFDSEVTFIKPFGITDNAYMHWMASCKESENRYFLIVDELKKQGMDEKEIPSWARSVLPNSLKTELVMTANAREWRHFFSLRAAAPAHPQMREVACPLLREFRRRVHVLFDDVGDILCDGSV